MTHSTESDGCAHYYVEEVGEDEDGNKIRYVECLYCGKIVWIDAEK